MSEADGLAAMLCSAPSKRLLVRVRAAMAERKDPGSIGLRELRLQEIRSVNGLMHDCETITGSELRFARKALRLQTSTVERILGLTEGLLDVLEAADVVPVEIKRAMLLAGTATCLSLVPRCNT